MDYSVYWLRFLSTYVYYIIHDDVHAVYFITSLTPTINKTTTATKKRRKKTARSVKCSSLYIRQTPLQRNERKSLRRREMISDVLIAKLFLDHLCIYIGLYAFAAGQSQRWQHTCVSGVRIMNSQCVFIHNNVYTYLVIATASVFGKWF